MIVPSYSYDESNLLEGNSCSHLAQVREKLVLRKASEPANRFVMQFSALPGLYARNNFDKSEV
jgi:hypothetical protein